MTSNATNRGDRKLDKVVEDAFPASDPPAHSGVTGAERPAKPSNAQTSESQQSDAEPSDAKQPDERSLEELPTGMPTSDRHATETAHHREHEVKPE